ncbi:hypothetical protein GCM10025857_32700 [Alicyclobacillus contaminans]|nr:hypothetical protein GCM10025857_32700 [Alicyclobacillus contaminans]
MGSNGQSWTPHDAENNWAGIMTVREALVESRNVPAIRLLDEIHPQNAWPYVNKMGITPQSKTLTGQTTLTQSDESNLSAAIGGLTYGLTVQQMTSAYTTLANQGVWRPAYLIDKVVDRDGTVLYQHQSTPKSVFSAQTAYILTDILHGVLYDKNGTATAVGQNFPGQYISGKTGTTDDHRDGWFIGYTQKYTLGLWMGYDYNEVIPDGYPSGPDWYDLKFTVWNKMMAPILKKDPATKPWPKPPGIISMQVCSKSGALPTDLCTADHDVYTELFIQGTEPTTPCKTHVNALYTVINGRKYLATTNTPPNEIRQGIFLVPPEALPPGVVTADSAEYLPTQADPRGGQILQGSSGGQLQSVPAPTGLTVAVAGNGTSVTLSWSPVKGATSYTVWRATSPNGPFANVGGVVTGTTFTDTKPPKGGTGTVYYEVYAASNTTVSTPSTPVTVQLSALPSAGGGSGPGHSTGTGTNNAEKGNGTGLPDILWPNIGDTRSRD